MNEEKTVENRFATRREAALRQIAGIGPFIEGTLAKVPHKTCKHVAHRLTFKASARPGHPPPFVPPLIISPGAPRRGRSRSHSNGPPHPSDVPATPVPADRHAVF